MRPVEDLPAWSDVLAELIRVLIRIGLAGAVILVGRWLAHLVRKLMVRALERTDLTPSMATIFVAVAFYGMWLLTVMVALLVLGAPSAVVLTSVGVVFLILGISLQHSLQDLAAAVTFMLFKPFKLGDVMETTGLTGTVEDIGPFSTTLVVWDGKVVVLPNSKIQESGIINYTTKDSLVTDLMIRISFGADLDRARVLISEELAGDPRVLAEPAPSLPVIEEVDSWVRLSVRVGVLVGDYWDLQNDLLERIRIRLEEDGIEVPFPQAQVHLSAAPPASSPADAA